MLAFSGIASGLPLHERVLAVVQSLFYVNAAELVTTNDETVGFVQKVVFGKVVVCFLALSVQSVEFDLFSLCAVWSNVDGFEVLAGS